VIVLVLTARIASSCCFGSRALASFPFFRSPLNWPNFNSLLRFFANPGQTSVYYLTVFSTSPRVHLSCGPLGKGEDSGQHTPQRTEAPSSPSVPVSKCRVSPS